MNETRERYAEIGYAVVRIVFSFLYVCHGVQKLFGWFGGPQEPFLARDWFAGVIETMCGTLIGLGWFTSYAACIASGEMAAAYFIVHFPKAALPILNRGDNAALLSWAWLYVCIRGGGKWSLDHLRRTPERAGRSSG